MFFLFVCFIGATFEQRFEKLGAAFWEISSNLWKALDTSRLYVSVARPCKNWAPPGPQQGEGKVRYSILEVGELTFEGRGGLGDFEKNPR